MALINCSECGKEISDKAKSCPNCGVPINFVEDAVVLDNPVSDDILVCPKCLSTQLHSQHKGFSGGKALAGAVLTGGIGLLAGTIGSKDIQVTCLKCGNKFKAGEGRIIRPKEDEQNILIDNQLVELIKEGNMLAAVKLYKDHKGIGIAESKKYVEYLAKSKGLIPNSGSGCAGILLLLMVSTSSIAFLFI